MKSKNFFLGLEKQDEQLFKKILSTIPHKMYAFGSRVKGNYKKLSDIDLCLLDPIDDLELFEIRQKFEDSDLPMKVDIQIWKKITPSFQKIIQNELMLINQDS